MDINIVAGKSNALCLDKIFEVLKTRDKTKKHVILAPDRCLFSLEQKLFEKLQESCFFDVDVISLTRLSKKYINNNKKLLTKQSGVALTQKLLVENEDKLKAFKKTVNHIGFAETLFETICLYKSCNIRPQDVYVDDSLHYSNLKQIDIKLIYTLYEEYLSRDYTDSFNQLQYFLKLIDKNTFADTCFYFVEFEDFTSIMYEIILKIAKFSDKTYLTCTYGKDNNNSNIYSNKVYLDLIDLFKVNGLEFKNLNVEDYERKELSVIANNLFAYNIDSKSNCNNIFINSFNNIDEEIKYNVADIYSLCVNRGCSFSQIAMIVPSILEYKNKLKIELEKYDIPYYFDESASLKNHVLVRTLFDILNIIKGDFSVAEFVGIIKSSVLGFDYKDVYTYENYLKQYGLMPYQCINKNIVKNGDINNFFDMILNYQEKIIEITSNNEYIEICSDLFNYIVDRSKPFYDRQEPLMQRVYAQVLSKFENVKKDFVLVFGDNESTLANFIIIFKSYFESTNISLPPITSNTLFIADINSSYITSTDYVYILGCNEGKMPKFNLDNGLITDEEIARLPNAKKINPTIKMLNSRKLFKLFEVILKFNKALKLSYMLSNSEGNLYPNNLVNSLIDIFGLSVNFASNALDVINKSFYKMDYNNIIFNNLNNKVAVDNNLEYIKNWEIYKDNINFRKLVSTLYYANPEDNAELFNNYNLSAEKANVKSAKFFKNNTTSVSQIESYFNCPYKHFVRYGIKLKDSVDSKIKPSDIGTIIHEVLKETMPFIIKNLDKESAILEVAKNNLDKVLNLEQNRHFVQNISNKYVIKSLYNEVERICKSMINYITYSNFKPKYYEFRFNSEDYKISNIAITGAIDRVDIYDNNFIIIDYKTGSTTFNDYSEVLSGKKLQLLVYSKFFANKFNLQPAGVFYLPISNAYNNKDASKHLLNGVVLKDDFVIKNLDKKLVEENTASDIINLKTTKDGNMYNNNFYKYMCLSKEEFDYLLDFSLKQVSTAIDNITKGQITPEPLCTGGVSACDYCDYKSICNYLNNNDKISVVAKEINELKTGEEDGGI